MCYNLAKIFRRKKLNRQPQSIPKKNIPAKLAASTKSGVLPISSAKAAICSYTDIRKPPSERKRNAPHENGSGTRTGEQEKHTKQRLPDILFTELYSFPEQFHEIPCTFPAEHSRKGHNK